MELKTWTEYYQQTHPPTGEDGDLPDVSDHEYFSGPQRVRKCQNRQTGAKGRFSQNFFQEETFESGDPGDLGNSGKARVGGPCGRTGEEPGIW